MSDVAKEFEFKGKIESHRLMMILDRLMTVKAEISQLEYLSDDNSDWVVLMHLDYLQEEANRIMLRIKRNR